MPALTLQRWPAGAGRKLPAMKAVTTVPVTRVRDTPTPKEEWQ